jgi:hypothetical protein
MAVIKGTNSCASCHHPVSMRLRVQWQRGDKARDSDVRGLTNMSDGCHTQPYLPHAIITIIFCGGFLPP